MEHLRFVFLITMLLIATSCDRPLAEPEKVDPIYSDLENEARNAQSALDAEKKAYLDAKKRSEELAPRDPNRKRTTFEVYELEKKIKKLEEKLLYQELLVKKRLEYVKQVYPRRYQQKLAWPDQDEVDLYQTNKRLNRASRNWSERVPKLQDRLKPASEISKDAEKPTAESSAEH